MFRISRCRFQCLVEAGRLATLAATLTQVPAGFTLHPRGKRLSPVAKVFLQHLERTAREWSERRACQLRQRRGDAALPAFGAATLREDFPVLTGACGGISADTAGTVEAGADMVGEREIQIDGSGKRLAGQAPAHDAVQISEDFRDGGVLAR